MEVSLEKSSLLHFSSLGWNLEAGNREGVSLCWQRACAEGWCYFDDKRICTVQVHVDVAGQAEVCSALCERWTWCSNRVMAGSWNQAESGLFPKEIRDTAQSKCSAAQM